VILTPVLVHGLGNMYYGMWAIVGSLIDYSGLLDMGMRATVFRYVAYFRGANQRVALNQTFTTGLVISLFTMGVCMLIFVGLAFVLPPFFKFTGPNQKTFAWVVALMGAALAAALPGQFLSAYLRGLERFDFYNLGIIVHGILRGALLFVLLKLGYGIIAIVAGVLIMAYFFLVLHWFLVKWADPDLRVSLEDFDWKRTREMLNFGFYSFVFNSGETLRYSTDSFVIGRMLTVALVTPFSVATRLTEYFKTVIGGVSGPLMVRLSELSGRNQDEELQEEFLRSTRFSMLLSLFIGGLLIFNGKALIQLWVGPGYLISYPILFVLTVAYIVTWGQVACPLLIFARARQHKALSWWALAEGIANLVLSVLWVQKYGLLGVAMGTAVPLVFSKLFVQPWYVLRDLGMSWWRYIEGGMARATLVSAIFFAGSWFITQDIPAPVNFVSLAVACVWQSVFFAVLAYLLGLAPTDRVTVKITGRRFATSLGIVRSL